MGIEQPSFERLAKQEGRQEEIERGLQNLRNLMFQTIEIRFGQVPESLRTSIDSCSSTERLTDLHRQALLAKSLDDLPKQLS